MADNNKNDKVKFTLYIDAELLADLKERSEAMFLRDDKTCQYIEIMIADQLNRTDLVPKWWRTGRGI